MMTVYDKKLLTQSGNQTDSLEILLARRHSLVAQNSEVSVRLHHWNELVSFFLKN